LTSASIGEKRDRDAREDADEQGQDVDSNSTATTTTTTTTTAGAGAGVGVGVDGEGLLARHPLSLKGAAGQGLYLVPDAIVDRCSLDDAVTTLQLQSASMHTDQPKYYARLASLYNGMRNTCANRVFKSTASDRIDAVEDFSTRIMMNVEWLQTWAGKQEAAEQAKEQEQEELSKLEETIELTKAGTTGGTVRVFGQNVPLEDAIGSHACSLEARTCV
jgi:hypothetical protein